MLARCLLCRGQGLYFDKVTTYCLQCPDFGSRLAKLSAFCLGAVAALAVFSSLLRHPAGRRFAIVRIVRRHFARLAAYENIVQLQAKLKILFSFYGIIVAQNETYDAHLPASYTNVLNQAFGWVQLDVASLVLPSSCVPFPSFGWSSFRSWLLIMSIAPLLLAFIVALLSILRKTARLGWSGKSMKLGALDALPFALVVLFVFMPSVSMRIFQSWLCVEYQFDGRFEDEPIVYE